MTASALVDFPIERGVVIELVPGVVAALPSFERWNRAFFRDPRVEVVVADGRNYLLGSAEQFDVIVSDLFVPWHAGTGDLYSVRHFEATARRLAPGGLFAQWLPVYQLTVEELRTITASFLKAFPSATLWRADFHGTQPLLALVGWRGAPSLDAERLRAASEALSEVRAPAASFLSTPKGVGMLYVAGDRVLREWAEGAPLNTDDRPLIEYGSPGSAFTHRQKETGEMHSLLAGFRPRTWCCPGEWISEAVPNEVFEAADLLHDALMARAAHNFEREYRILLELAERSGDVPGVAEAIVAIAARYEQRGMVSRSHALLTTLVAFDEAPLSAALALAQQRLAAGDHAAAAVLLAEIVEARPGQSQARLQLVELLEKAGDFVALEAHLRHLLEATPDDAMLRVQLAHALHRQGRLDDARAEVERIRALPELHDRAAVWSALRRLGLLVYADDPVPPALGPGTDQLEPLPPLR